MPLNTLQFSKCVPLLCLHTGLRACVQSARRYIEKDKALERRFQQVLVEPPSVDETVSILRGLRERCACVSEGENMMVPGLWPNAGDHHLRG